MDLHTSDDLRSLPDRILNLLLYAVAGWGVALLVCFLWHQTALAIPLTYVVFLWQAVVTAWWGVGMLRRYDRGEITLGEANAGVESVSHILLASSLLPAIVFVAENPVPDPFPGPGLSAAASIAVLSGLAFGITTASLKLSNRWSHIGILALSSATLPINATGAFSVAAAYGLFDSLFLS